MRHANARGQGIICSHHAFNLVRIPLPLKGASELEERYAKRERRAPVQDPFPTRIVAKAVAGRHDCETLGNVAPAHGHSLPLQHLEESSFALFLLLGCFKS